MDQEPPADWFSLLAREFEKRYWCRLQEYVAEQRRDYVVYPPEAEVFAAMRLTPCERTKVVIIGQDPYTGEGQANGLCFSVGRGVPIPHSLRNILQELHTDEKVPIPAHGDLTSWARQGVLLLNRTLTVRAGERGSHRGKGWSRFTSEVVKAVAAEREPVFILWGNDAQRMRSLIGNCPVIASTHPSPLSAHKGFVGSKPFSKANEALVRQGRKGIDWRLAR
jgi:uracil-DNA glycosylase